MPPEDTSPFGIDWKIACGPKYVFSVVWKEFAITTVVAFRAKCKMFSRHLQKPILKTEKGRFKGL